MQKRLFLLTALILTCFPIALWLHGFAADGMGAKEAGGLFLLFLPTTILALSFATISLKAFRWPFWLTLAPQLLVLVQFMAWASG